MGDTGHIKPDGVSPKKQEIPNTDHFDPSAEEKTVKEPTEQELMDKYGITFENDKYHYGKYSYDQLKDALNYAKLQDR